MSVEEEDTFILIGQAVSLFQLSAKSEKLITSGKWPRENWGRDGRAGKEGPLPMWKYKTECKTGTTAKGRFIKWPIFRLNITSLPQGQGYTERKYCNGS